MKVWEKTRNGVFVCEKVQQNEETMLRVRNGTKQGYDEAHVGDGISLAYPESDTRRGRVGKGCSQTLDCSGQMGTLMKCGRIRRLTPRECFRLQGFPDVLFDKAASVNSDPKGCRVVLERMDDMQAPPIGTEGTVRGVDDTGSIMVKWDNGAVFM